VNPVTDGVSDASGAAVADFNNSPFYNDGDFALAVGKLEHVIEFFSVSDNIYVFCFAVGQPGLVGVRSPGFTIDNDFVRHVATSYQVLVGCSF